jgi:formylglycine-generating enzyme required for sulfatase activity
MLGNVFEWVQDGWHDNYRGAPTDGSTWGKQRRFLGRLITELRALVELESGDSALRVVRGGSWGGLLGGVRSAFRHRYEPDYRSHSLGFRLAQDI